jgi:5-formyltetrahydrofolate cyclo-ligase
VHAQEPDAVARKRAIRHELLTRRRALPPDDRAAADVALRDLLLAELRRTGTTTVAAYVPVGTEPGGAELPEALHAAGVAVLLPVLEPDGDLDWAAFTGELVAGPRGLREPAGPRCGHDAVARVGAVIVPAVAVDRHGVRLGRGGGSYDRALARLGAGVHTVALLYDGEFVDAVPAEPHDRRVGTVLTPAGVHRLG